MGLFNFFNKKAPQVIVKDMIWMNGEGKMQGCLKLLQQHKDAVLLAWFPKTQQLWEQFMLQHQLPNKVHLTQHLNTLQLSGKSIIMLEHYPLAGKEDTFLQALHQQEVFILSALDEPLFTQFGSENIIALMQKMGMQQDEVIEHKMVSASLRKAQSKLETKVTVEHTAQSMQDWFSKNIG